ncbi:metallophosphoesterase MPPED2-like [Mizuhopecten yessoensis]|uniref:Metallophosphoesterase domain-containing protein 1 n=1 Tax=Mizuhopecten yessoensis TaxID=6573 RepID=A0A210PHA6_MIZYE|nr:metallophosphoesterase MPPED2-like [Mizuhopecten yessoensis]OWF35862.1 Metallophosphoesterase domain-containing protein 1 [Mizuhopecten yessoensis]
MAMNDSLDTDSDFPIAVDADTKFPCKAWERLLVKTKYEYIPPKDRLDSDTPVSADCVRVVCISDTHSKIEVQDPKTIPYGDILLHAGDFTMKGEPNAVHKFNTFLGQLPHKHKIVIAGNHEISFDDNIMSKDHLDPMFGSMNKYVNEMSDLEVKSVKDLLTNCIYLEDSMVSLYGINIYGSPWQPAFGGWGFCLPRGEALLEKWKHIPTNTDILMTHGPPVGYGDVVKGGNHVGCVELLNVVQKVVKPKYHVFGHIHEGYGVSTDGCTTFINASTCTTRYRPSNPAVVLDFPLPSGHSKEEDPIIIHTKVPQDLTAGRKKKMSSAKSRVNSALYPGNNKCNV